MHQSSEGTNQIESRVNCNRPFANYSQPWWHGVGHNTASQNNALEQHSGSLGNEGGKLQANGEPDEGAVKNKEVQNSVTPQGDESSRGEPQDSQNAVSMLPFSKCENATPPAQLELVGYSIACSSYPFSDQYYGGTTPSFGSQSMVHPQFYGFHSSRMPLPLEMTEEPVYVNAKQYHGILRRRQSRAKAELKKKSMKVKKPYLHESRHLHAMRRARGCGGRFLNTKELAAAMSKNDNATDSGTAFYADPSSSVHCASISPGNTISLIPHGKVNVHAVEEVHNACTFSNLEFQMATFTTPEIVDDKDSSGKHQKNGHSMVLSIR